MEKQSHSHPDRESFDLMWKKVIWPEIQDYLERYYGAIECIPQAKSIIWQKYCELNEYCKRNYMKSQEEKIDRHKVAACYMLAICIVHPIYILDESRDKICLCPAVNEQIAITVGFSLLRAFVESSIKENERVDSTTEELKRLEAIFSGGIKIPEGNLVNHGDYIENFANELHYAVSDGKACILSVAHELYLLELYTRIIGQSELN